MPQRRGLIAQGRPRTAQPILHVGLVGQQVPGLAEVLRHFGGGQKIRKHRGGVAVAQRLRPRASWLRTSCPDAWPSPPSHG